MFRPQKMCRAQFLVLEKHREQVTRLLGRLGVIHLTKSELPSSVSVVEATYEETLRQYMSLLERGRALFAALRLPPTGPEAARLSFEDPAATLGGIESSVQQLQAKLQELTEREQEHERQIQQLASFPWHNISFRRLRELYCLYIVVGTIPGRQTQQVRESLDAFASILTVDVGDHEERILVIASRKRRNDVDVTLRNAGWREERFPVEWEETAAQEMAHLRTKQAAIRRERESKERELATITRECARSLVSLVLQLQEQIDIAQAQRHFAQCGPLVSISGWIPASRTEQALAEVSTVTGGAHHVTLRDPQQHEAVPVKFTDSRLLAPFHSLVSAVGAPRYQHVEPTLFVATSFVIMFGIMFGDVGQGLVFLLTGLLVATGRLRWLPASAVMRNFGYLLFLCGISAAFFGLLYGSVFGSEHVLRGWWLHPLRDITSLFVTALACGVVFLLGAMSIGVANKLLEGNKLEALLGKQGVCGVWLYAGIVYCGAAMVAPFPLGASELMLALILPLIILYIAPPLLRLARHERSLFPEGFVLFLFEGFLEILETITGFLANTISFIRLAGFTLSHAALCLVMYSIVDLLAPLPFGNVWSFLVIVGGNMLVMALEGLVVTIQAIRLQFYELFSKYFVGDGVFFEPFRLAHSGDQ